ncbi:MAG: DHHA1 domain-containing protein, partial [Nitrospirota bacterium]|nr:DHHA1 domain-containing protein [Nitrospirota bacterium]
GVAFKLVQAISQLLEMRGQRPELHPLSSYLDLVALGTIADVAPLTGENRIFVKEGLALLTAEKRIGIAALKEVSGIGGGEVAGGTIGFILAPRINAAGRLSRADIAVRMLTTGDSQEARGIAASLDQVNQERQRIESRIRDEVREKIAGEIDLNKEKVIVMASQEWHQGVIGIVASKVVDEFYRPCVLISLQEDGSGKGSARSIPRFNIYKGLEACSDLLERFGGHKYAAGLTIKSVNIPLLRERLSAVIAERMKEQDLTPQIILDAEITLDEISFPLLKEMTLLPPYGMANPEPVIVTKGLRIVEPRIVGKDHLKMRLKKGRVYLDSIGFSMGSAYNDIITSGREIDIAYTPELNFWKGTYGVQLRLKDLRPADGNG